MPLSLFHTPLSHTSLTPDGYQLRGYFSKEKLSSLGSRMIKRWLQLLISCLNPQKAPGMCPERAGSFMRELSAFLSFLTRHWLGARGLEENKSEGVKVRVWVCCAIVCGGSMVVFMVSPLCF